ncbi:NHLP bacteriocin system secretion protein [Rhodoferax aquaticus]|uniref:NHLP bacteriocin system secretion protein n=1 Tax=Rhodoferax aquaticus TaxID=2527691 RepID=A0A515EKP5_9BURK|nr:NHLP bacteriocin system secretion protein [Rhodoferax aquaticus]QDL53179.1 NHLP bacteriocin system secretion protein [Rhodoferax aquaticus]
MIESSKSSNKESTRPLNIVSPAYLATAWLFVGSVLALLIGCFLVRVPVVVNGQGVLMADGEVINYAISPETDGRLEAFLVKVGSPVKKGQTIALVSIPRLDNDLQTARSSLQDLMAKAKRLDSFHAESMEVATGTFKQVQIESRSRDGALRERLSRLEKTRQGNAELIVGGFLSSRASDPVVTEREQVEDQLAVNKRQLLDAQTNYSELAQRQKRESLELNLQISAQQRQIDALTERAKVENRIVSPYDGVISELLVDVHQPVSRERRVAMVTPANSVKTSSNVVRSAVVFVPAQEGKKIAPGMPVKILPLIYEEQEFGRIEGVVTQVSAVAADEDVLLRVFKNQKLVRKLFEADAPYKVTVQVTQDAQTPSGMAWTSSRGPARLMEPGTIVSGRVVYNQPRLLYLLLPAVKRVGESAWFHANALASGPTPLPEGAKP